jgi:hypothetical protein
MFNVGVDLQQNEQRQQIPAIRMNVGGVIFALGLPFTVIGIILTAVGYTVTEEKRHIWYFEIVGPILLGFLSVRFKFGSELRKLFRPHLLF